MPDSLDNESVASTTVSSGGERPDMAETVPNRAHVALNGQIEMPVARKVAGVLLRRNASPQPPNPVELMNRSVADVQVRQQTLAEILRNYLASKQCPADSVVLVALESDVTGSPVRAVCTFAPGCVSSEDSLPRFIRSLERHIRTMLKVPIEVLADEQKDRNKLRQLIVVAKSSDARE